MRHRRLLVLLAVLAAFAAIVIASSMGSTGSATHSMPDGQTMPDADMAR